MNQQNRFNRLVEVSHLCHSLIQRRQKDYRINPKLLFIRHTGRQFLKLLHFIFLSLTYAPVSSQVIVMSGIVLDEHHEPIANCHIAVKNTSQGTITNQNGEFNLKIPKSHCAVLLLVSHVGYQTQTVKFNCRRKSNLIVVLNDKTVQLKDITITALSPSQIVLQAISNLEKNHQVEAVTYTLFSRITETKDTLPVLIEEFVVDLYHGKKSEPSFYIEKIRTKAFSELGKKRLSNNRLTDVYVTGSHIILRYLPPFLKRSKMKRYHYTQKPDIVVDDDRYYVIIVNSTKNNYPDKGILWINQKNYGIRYLEIEYPEEHWQDISHLDYKLISHYKQMGDKWYFVHGTRSYNELLKDKKITINHQHITVATDRGHTLPAADRPKMGVMIQFLNDHSGSYNDEFWEQHNFIPLDARFRDN